MATLFTSPHKGFQVAGVDEKEVLVAGGSGGAFRLYPLERGALDSYHDIVD
jgi:hypothetical protein